MFGVKDLVKCFRVIVIEEDRILVSMLQVHSIYYIFHDWEPTAIDVSTRARPVNYIEASIVDVQNYAL